MSGTPGPAGGAPERPDRAGERPNGRQVEHPEGKPGERPELSEQDIALLSDGTIFRLRTRWIERIQQTFSDVRERLSLHVEGGAYLKPAAADLEQSRLARGEHLDDMPYVYLDYPSFFDRQAFFTFRSLFWWGHGISFSLLLAGEHLPEYRHRLLTNLGILEALDVHVATADTPWDWERGPGHTMRLAREEQATLQRLFRGQTFLKCVRYLDFADPDFRRNRIDEAALLTFRALEPIILA